MLWDQHLGSHPCEDNRESWGIPLPVLSLHQWGTDQWRHQQRRYSWEFWFAFATAAPLDCIRHKSLVCWPWDSQDHPQCGARGDLNSVVVLSFGRFEVVQRGCRSPFSSWGTGPRGPSAVMEAGTTKMDACCKTCIAPGHPTKDNRCWCQGMAPAMP